MNFLLVLNNSLRQVHQWLHLCNNIIRPCPLGGGRFLHCTCHCDEFGVALKQIREAYPGALLVAQPVHLGMAEFALTKGHTPITMLMRVQVLGEHALVATSYAALRRPH